VRPLTDGVATKQQFSASLPTTGDLLSDKPAGNSSEMGLRTRVGWKNISFMNDVGYRAATSAERKNLNMSE
jgi:hypothetical protein